MLDPLAGRFLQRDPLGYPDGMNAYAAYHVLFGGVDSYGLQQGDLEEVNAVPVPDDVVLPSAGDLRFLIDTMVVNEVTRMVSGGRDKDAAEAIADRILATMTCTFEIISVAYLGREVTRTYKRESRNINGERQWSHRYRDIVKDKFNLTFTLECVCNPGNNVTEQLPDSKTGLFRLTVDEGEWQNLTEWRVLEPGKCIPRAPENENLLIDNPAYTAPLYNSIELTEEHNSTGIFTLIR